MGIISKQKQQKNDHLRLSLRPSSVSHLLADVSSNKRAVKRGCVRTAADGQKLSEANEHSNQSQKMFTYTMMLVSHKNDVQSVRQSQVALAGVSKLECTEV